MRGQLVVENEGVSPDVEVFDDAGSRVKGGDPTLEKCVEILLKELEKPGPWKEPKVPTPPDMTTQEP